ncbi:MAG TPA: LON peptidase substrate-binding domain-containing protein [Thermoguttaceae bacterium]|nr:LON peptidase substrate-binding domain-containing protein [Thermoguttaceae bacterium]
METFENLCFSFENFSGTARLFPLPNLVLFPHVMQPLHIFEPRYRALLEDALKSDGLIAMATLAPGWESDYEGRPPLYPTACLGRIATHRRLGDGTYNVLVLGLRRVRLLGELEPSRAFREARVEVCEDHCPPEQAACRAAIQHKLHEALLKILPMLPDAHEQLDHLLGTDLSLGMLTDVIGFMLELEIQQKEALLAEVNVLRRAESLLGHLATLAVDDQPNNSCLLAFPPPFSAN